MVGCHAVHNILRFAVQFDEVRPYNRMRTLYILRHRFANVVQQTDALGLGDIEPHFTGQQSHEMSYLDRMSQYVLGVTAPVAELAKHGQHLLVERVDSSLVGRFLAKVCHVIVIILGDFIDDLFDPGGVDATVLDQSRLVKDGRIHPTRIEEVVNKVTEDNDYNMANLGEEAAHKAGVNSLNKEVLAMLGKLRYRSSYSQNVLAHSVEVAHLMGLLAGEMGLDIAKAKRIGLLHDIGKSMTQDVEGPHAIVGADFIKLHGEPEDVVNGVASHHGEVPYDYIWGILVSAADAISASRPGARSETMTTYLKRLSNLEKIGSSFDGVEKCYAVQAGREVRVLVNPKKVSDDASYDLARQIARKIEDELQYPGHIRVTMVRENRFVEYAK